MGEKSNQPTADRPKTEELVNLIVPTPISPWSSKLPTPQLKQCPFLLPSYEEETGHCSSKKEKMWVFLSSPETLERIVW